MPAWGWTTRLNAKDDPRKRLTAQAEPTREYGQLLAAMAWDPVDADSLVARSGLTIGEVSSMLLMLEMQGSVRALSGGRYQRAGKNRSVDA